MDTCKQHQEQANKQEKLQWGHALSGMDTMRIGENLPTSPRGFNGAMPFQAWIRHSSFPVSF